MSAVLATALTVRLPTADANSLPSYIIEQQGQTILVKDASTGQTIGSGADAAAIIQDRLDAMSDGGRIFLRAGTYSLSKGLKIRHKHITLEGEGYVSAVLRLGDNLNQDVIEVVGPPPRAGSPDSDPTNPSRIPTVSYLAFRNLKIDGNRQHNTQGCGVKGPMHRCLFQDVHICEVAEDGIRSPRCGTGLKVTRAVIENVGQCGICVRATDSWITDTTITRAGKAGIDLTAAATKVNQTHIWGCQVGITIGEDESCTYFWVCDCYIESCLKGGIKLGPRSVYGGVISGNVFWRNSWEKADTWDDISDQLVEPHVMTRVIITDNYFPGHKWSRHNICLGPHSEGNTITHNVFRSLSAPVSQSGGSNTLHSNLGYVTDNSGSVSIPAGKTSVDVPHGLAVSPATVQLTPTGDTVGKRFWVDAKGAETFTVHIDAPYTASLSFDWAAKAGKTDAAEAYAENKPGAAKK